LAERHFADDVQNLSTLSKICVFCNPQSLPYIHRLVLKDSTFVKLETWFLGQTYLISRLTPQCQVTRVTYTRFKTLVANFYVRAVLARSWGPGGQGWCLGSVPPPWPVILGAKFGQSRSPDWRNLMPPPCQEMLIPYLWVITGTSLPNNYYIF
jgi:hypothetical protein